MHELPFRVELEWAGRGREGAGRIVTDDLELELSTPESMGGRGAGTNPEELLVSAVGSCYIATLYGVLTRRELPVASISLEATGTVTGFPVKSNFERLVVSPTIAGGDAGRVHEYEQAAADARDRCFIGGVVKASVDYQVGVVAVEPAPVAA